MPRSALDMAAGHGKAGPKRLNESTCLKFLEQFQGRVVLLVGHSSGGSYADMPTALLEADEVGARFSQAVEAGASHSKAPGKGGWCIVYGGDRHDSSRPTIGNIVQHLHAEWGASVLAVQHIFEADRGGVPDFCSAVVWHGDLSQDPPVYAGLDSDGKPRGATALYLGRTFLSHLAGVVAFGGGRLAAQEVQYAVQVGLPLKYVPCAPASAPGWGATHEALLDMGVTVDVAPGLAGDPSEAALREGHVSEETLAAVKAELVELGAEQWAARANKAFVPPKPLPDSRTCMTMHQPWASLMVQGYKRAEGRVWTPRPPFTGRLWIHAGGKVPEPETVLAVEAQYKALLLAAGVPEEEIQLPPVYPTGMLIGSVDIPAVLPNAVYRSALVGQVPPSVLAESSAPYVFLCQNPQVLLEPIAMPGSFKLWRLPNKVWHQAREGCEPASPPEPVAFPPSVATLGPQASAGAASEPHSKT